MTNRRAALALACAALLVTACSGDDADDDPTAATGGEPTTETSGTADTAGDTGSADVSTGDGTGGATGDQERCEQNREAGTITFLTSFDFAAAASIIDVVIAEDRGYYDELCLDVEVIGSLSTENYPLVAAGTAQFSSGGSFAEVASFAAANDTEFVVVAVEGNVPIDVLIVKAGLASELADLAGQTIGVQGRTPMSIAAMLASAGLTDNEDFTSVPLAGVDAAANIEPDELAGITGYKSNEVGQLAAAGIEVELFDPADYDVAGSFGAIYTTAEYLEEHPTVVEDFLRATLRGLEDALADPAAAAEVAIAYAEDAGNAFFLSLEGETFRWETEAALVQESAIAGRPIGWPNVEALQAELDSYAPFGLFGDGETPDASALVDASVIEAIHDGTTLIWPG